MDALLIRSLLLPAVMHRIGPANWYLPARLGRVLPRLDIEAGQHAATEKGTDGGSDGDDELLRGDAAAKLL